MKIAAWSLALLLISIVAVRSTSLADESFGPGDPFAAIDGEPIFLGEMNLILADRFQVRDLDAVPMDVKQATAALLVRQHLAFRSLQQQGGAALQSIVDQQIESLAAEAKRSGSSLAEQAKSRLSDETSLKAYLAWRAAWGRYLKSQLNAENLRRYFEHHKSRYAGGRWQVSQIFVDIDAEDAESIALTQQRMTALAGELKSAASPEAAFAQAAREHSDAGSSDSGGMVGWVQRDGDLPQAVMDVVRGTPPAQLGGPVLSPMGMHLIYVHQSQPGELTFDQLTDRSQLTRDATNDLFDTLVRRQADAKIVWFIAALKPPASVPIIPKQ